MLLPYRAGQYSNFQPIFSVLLFLGLSAHMYLKQCLEHAAWDTCGTAGFILACLKSALPNTLNAKIGPHFNCLCACGTYNRPNLEEPVTLSPS